jgi:hypothetical protein
MMVSTDGNGWSSCIDDNNYDNIKINFDMWCQPPHTTNLYNLVQRFLSESPPPPNRAAHPAGDPEPNTEEFEQQQETCEYEKEQ